MDNITKVVRNEIKKQYKSVRRFSLVSGIPYSTISNALTKGIGGTSYETVEKILKLLDIKQADGSGVVFNNKVNAICHKLSSLDEQALHTIETVLSVEYERCVNSKKS